jgi:Cytochrome b5-like Heme/Steroid binding domain
MNTSSSLLRTLAEVLAVVILVYVVIAAVEDKPKVTSSTTMNTSLSSGQLLKPRMITAEELASKNGSDVNKTLWLSIMSEVFDVSSAPQYYAPNATYNIFVGRDANVPFVTGRFTPEEAAKSISNLTDHEVWIVDHFLNDTYKTTKSKYTFVGLLIGELYDKDGNPSDILLEARVKIAKQKIVKAEQEAKRQELLAERRRKDAEKAEAAKLAAAAGADVETNGHLIAEKPKPRVVTTTQQKVTTTSATTASNNIIQPNDNIPENEKVEKEL